MKRLLLLPTLALLTGCNALGGIPNDTLNTLASAGGGCVAVESLVMGKAVVMVGGAEKGSLKNGSVVISGQCGGIAITNQQNVPPVPPIR